MSKSSQRKLDHICQSWDISCVSTQVPRYEVGIVGIPAYVCVCVSRELSERERERERFITRMQKKYVYVCVPSRVRVSKVM